MKHLFLVAALAVVFAAGCQTSKSASGLSRPTNPADPAARAEISVGDSILVKFTRHPEFDTRGVIETDGTLMMPLLGSLQFAGKTTSEMRDELIAAYSKYLKNIDIVITTENPSAAGFAASCCP